MTIIKIGGKRYRWNYSKALPGALVVLGLAALAIGAGVAIGWLSDQTAALMGGAL